MLKCFFDALSYFNVLRFGRKKPEDVSLEAIRSGSRRSSAVDVKSVFTFGNRSGCELIRMYGVIFVLRIKSSTSNDNVDGYTTYANKFSPSNIVMPQYSLP